MKFFDNYKILQVTLLADLPADLNNYMRLFLIVSI